LTLDPENGNARGRVIEGQPEARMRMLISSSCITAVISHQLVAEKNIPFYALWVSKFIPS